jgi:methyltransferase (TIGR00027 family)
MNNPVSLTAFYTCGIRMLDAAAGTPIVGDRYARHFMCDEGMKVLDRFRGLHYPNTGNLTRHRIIDEYLQHALRGDPAANVLLIGSGFDTRAFRLRGGCWTEIDEPEIIARKEARLPSLKCTNPLRRVPIRFGVDSLADKLLPRRNDRRVIVVLEGVLLYLDAGQIRELTATLRQTFPRHRLVCDLVSARFLRLYSQRLQRVIRSLGASFKNFAEDPEAFVAHSGYKLVQKVSVIERATDLGKMKIPRFVLRMLRSLTQGYSVCIFDAV